MKSVIVPLSVLAVLASPSFGQRVLPPAPATAATVELSPFLVDASKDVGYQGGNTSSGSRLNTSLKDTAATVQVFTPEFLEDLGANSLAEVLAYGTSVQPDLTDTSPDFGGSPNGRPDSGRQDFVFKSRGLDTSRMVDFFNTNIPIDTYNTGRLEQSSGPNAVLFGIGAAGGSINASTKRALAERNLHTLRSQVGSWDTWRLETDVNQVLRPNVLALRVMGVTESAETWRTWEYSKQKRLTAAVTVRPWTQTGIHLGYETGRADRSISQQWNAEDQLKLWLTSGRPLRSGLWTAANLAADQPLGVTTMGTGSLNTFIESDGSYANFRNLRQSTYANLSLPATQRPTDATLLPTSLMPYRVSWMGPGAFFRTDFNARSLTVTQQVARGLNLEAAYRRERTAIDLRRAFVGVLRGDPNSQTVNAAGALVANPNAGRLYLEDNWGRAETTYDTESMRLSLNYEAQLGRWGRHLLGAMWQGYQQDTYTMDFFEILVDASNRPIGTATNPAGTDSRLYRRRYVTEGDYRSYYNGDARIPFNATINGVAYHSAYVHGNTNQMTLGTEKTDTMMATLQSSFFRDRVVTTFGWRRDQASTRRNGIGVLAATDPRVTRGERLAFEQDFTNDVSVYDKNKPPTYSAGVVWHALPWLSASYNRSTSVSTPGLRETIFPDGELRPPSSGAGEDYALMFSLLDGKTFLRINRYRTEDVRGSGANIQNLVVAPRNRINNALLLATVITQADYDARNINARAALADKVSTGWEANLTTNLTKGWALQGSYSYTDYKVTNWFDEFAPWFEETQVFWKARLAAAGKTTTDVRTATAAALGTVQDEINGMLTAVQEQREIFELNYGMRPHKASVFTRYSFSEGRLKGAFVGGGLRYQSKNVLQKNFSTGAILEGGEVFATDALMGYTTRVSVGSRRIQCRFQLNVRNVLDETKPIIGRYNSDFSGVRRVILLEPRSFRFTTTFEF